MPAFMPDTSQAGDREYRAQEAHDDAEFARDEFERLAARHAQEAIALAAKLGVEPDARQLRRAQEWGQPFAHWLTVGIKDATMEQFHLPDPSEAYDAVMGDD